MSVAGAGLLVVGLVLGGVEVGEDIAQEVGGHRRSLGAERPHHPYEPPIARQLGLAAQAALQVAESAHASGQLDRARSLVAEVRPSRLIVACHYPVSAAPGFQVSAPGSPAAAVVQRCHFFAPVFRSQPFRKPRVPYSPPEMPVIKVPLAISGACVML